MSKNNETRWQIHFYEDHRGKLPALEYVNELPAKERARIHNTLQLLESYGTALGMPHARRIQGKLWELRPGANRLFYFAYIRRKFVVLHAFRKKTQRTPKREVRIALRRMQEILEE